MTGNWGLCENSEKLKDFVCRKNEFGVKLGCLLWGSRVVIPLKLREKVLSQLHNCHPGVSQMKALSSFVWWPNIDRDIENTVKNCRNCQMNKNNPIKAPIHPWEWTNKPCVRLHLDYAGPYHNKMFLTVCSCHVTYAFESESTLYSCLNVKDKFGQMVECSFKN